MHGAIGFQPYWLREQGYSGKNLLQLLADQCFARDIKICAVTSQEDHIPPLSVHDRFGILREVEAPLCLRDIRLSQLAGIFLLSEKIAKKYFL